jgi:hypothetical protein
MRESVRQEGGERTRHEPIRIQRPLRNERKIQRGASDGAERVRHHAVWRRAREPRKAFGLGADRLLSAVRAPFDSDERATETGQGPRIRGRERETLRLWLRRRLQERAGATHAGIEMVEEGVVDHAEDGNALVDQAQRDARVGEAVHEVGRPVCGAGHDDWWVMSRSALVRRTASERLSEEARSYRGGVPMGSTQNVGASVRGGRVPEE